MTDEIRSYVETQTLRPSAPTVIWHTLLACLAAIVVAAGVGVVADGFGLGDFDLTHDEKPKPRPVIQRIVLDQETIKDCKQKLKRIDREYELMYSRDGGTYYGPTSRDLPRYCEEIW